MYLLQMRQANKRIKRIVMIKDFIAAWKIKYIMIWLVRHVVCRQQHKVPKEKTS